MRPAMRRAAAIAMVLMLPAAAVRAADPPPFSGASRQFTLVVPAKKAPLGTVEDEKGGKVDLGAMLKGKVVLLNLWATWCAPCVVELPTLDALQRELGGGDFEVVAVSVDRRGMDVVGPFWKERGYRHLAIRLDPGGKLMRDFGTIGLPTSYLIARDGTVAGYLEGHGDWASPEAQQLVRFFLAAR